MSDLTLLGLSRLGGATAQTSDLENRPHASSSSETLEANTSNHVLVGRGGVLLEEGLVHTTEEGNDSSSGEEGNGGILLELALSHGTKGLGLLSMSPGNRKKEKGKQ